jgi:hypothetical protein
MKKILFFTFLASTLFMGCSKQVQRPVNINPEKWMQTHEEGRVAFTDYFNGNYIVETNRGYTVIEAYGGYTPGDFDFVYGNFSYRGVQDIYNYNGNYFTTGRVVDYWLSYSQARYLLDELSY